MELVRANFTATNFQLAFLQLAHLVGSQTTFTQEIKVKLKVLKYLAILVEIRWLF